MDADQFSVENSLYLCQLYKKHLGGAFIDSYIENTFNDLEKIVEELREDGRAALERIGSDHEYQTHFRIKRVNGKIELDVNLNFDPKSRKGPIYEEAEKACARFMQEAYEYLGYR